MQTMLPAGRTQVTTPVEVPPELERDIRAIGARRRRGLLWAVAAAVLIAITGVIWWQLATTEAVEIHDSWMNVPVVQAEFGAEIHDSWDNVPPVEGFDVTEIHDSWARTFEQVEVHDSWETATP